MILNISLMIDILTLAVETSMLIVSLVSYIKNQK